MNNQDTITTSLGASGWDEDRIDIIGSNGNDGLAYSAPAWNGEGLPPVGTECEAVWLEPPDGGSRDFEPVLIKGIHRLGNNCAQIWFCTAEGEDIVMLEGNCSFRPIPSEEKRAIKEMMGVLKEQVGIWDASETIARALYREGYRKLEATHE